MNTLSLSVFRAFATKYYKKEKHPLLLFLSEKDQQIYGNLPPCEGDLSLGFDRSTQLLQACHYSRLAPFLRTLSEQEIALFLSVLPEEKQKLLQDLLLLSSIPSPPPSVWARMFLKNRWESVLAKEFPDLPPEAALPPSPLNALLRPDAPPISKIIDFLGLYELASEMRLIIDTIQIKKIRSFLNPEQQAFLRIIGGTRHILPGDPKKQFNSPGLSEKNFPELLHTRGLFRLADILSSEHKDLVRHILLRLNTEESEKLTTFSSSKKGQTRKPGIEMISEISTFLKKQTLRGGL